LPESYSDLIPEDNPSYSPLRPGMSATVEIRTEYADNILIIPIGAVTTRNDTTASKEENTPDNINDKQKKKDFIEVVFLYDEGIARMVEVEIGIQDNTNIEIKGGLKEGDEVVTGPYSLVSKTLTDGDELKKTDRDDLFKEN
jgi:HlyD family secretion protein